ncbi:MAG: hypothetical protein KDB60_04185 [Propionibacteriaceae bacterium]|nr:hypothetical protein [Propionibacteriaceae bacterium]
MVRERALKLLRAPATGAAVAQVWQALGSFALQIAAAWLLGASGLGLISLTLGVIVFATALSSGVVGDSLVILDRRDRVVRGGLEGMAVIINLVSMVATAATLVAVGLLPPVAGVWFALALGAFQLEDLARRVLMATMRFWRLVVVDSTALLFTLSTMGIWYLAAPITVEVFLLAVFVGQTAGLVAGLILIPRDERRLVPITWTGIRQVAGFGMMRGIQVSLTPGLLTATRMIVIVILGTAALGQVEAARIFVAPALLIVQGLGSYLLASYARDKQLPVVRLIGRSRSASLKLLAASLGAGVALTLLAPVLGHWITGPSFSVDQVAVAGWALYVAGSATVQPFASLGAVLGRQPIVLACRLTDATLALVLVWVLLGPLSLSASLTPYALATGLFLGGFLVRHFALRPLTNPGPGDSTGNLTTTRTSHVHA